MFTYISSFSGYSVDDLDAAKRFYGETLGITVTEQPEDLQLELTGGNPVFLYQKSNHEPATYTVLNFVVSDIEQAVDELTEAGIQFEHYSEGMLKTDDKGIAHGSPGEPGPTGIAWFKDPAGNFLSVIQE
jgi:catechol 2,3-dioxygenase-like lactoylglutathione lyase family enzyme